jgi:diketogulonate reductase-like aldo/keto reductase
VGRVLKQRSRKEVYLVSKVYPHHAGKNRIFKACDATLGRLGTDYLDLYLLHWRGSVALQETVECMQELVKSGKIARWGVSNFDMEDMQELLQCQDGDRCVVNQVLYHLGSRGVEYCLAPFLQSKGIVLMAYCPLAQAGRLQERLLTHPTVCNIAEQNEMSPIQVLLGFVLYQNNTVAIPRSGSCAHVQQNAQMAQKQLSVDDIEMLNKVFPAPEQRVALDME